VTGTGPHSRDGGQSAMWLSRDSRIDTPLIVQSRKPSGVSSVAAAQSGVASSSARARRAARHARREVRDAAANPWLALAARLGYVVRGVLYGTMGVLALGLAVLSHGETTDQRGSLRVLAANPLGKLLIGVVIVGLVGYSLWGYIRAVYDPLHRGADPVGVAARLGFLWSGLSYTALLIFSIQFLLGAAGNSDGGFQGLVRGVLAHSFGPVAVGIAGLVGVGAGLGQFVDAWKASFKKDLKRTEMTNE